MEEQFEIYGYTLTSDTSLFDERDGMTDSLKWELEKLYPQIKKANKSVIRKILHLIEKYPKNPQLKNFLTSAYMSAGNESRAFAANDWLIKEHPDYLFGLLNKANQALLSGESELVPQLLGETLDLKELYPDRDIFHVGEFTGLGKLAVFYYAYQFDFEQAEIRLKMLEEIAYEHPDTVSAREILIKKRLEAGAKRFEKEQKTKIKIEGVPVSAKVQTAEPPSFTHHQIGYLYEADTKIKKEKLVEILALPRKSLIKDLVKVLKDGINRYNHFKDLEELGNLSDEQNFFVCHAMYLLGELEAEEVLEEVLDIFKYDSDFLQFWFFDLLTESFWYIFMRLGKNKLPALKEFILAPNIDTYARAEISVAVSQMALHYPEKNEECRLWFQEILGLLSQTDANSGIVDSDAIALMIGDIISINEKSLLPEIEKLYELGYVSEGIVGNFASVKKDIGKPSHRDKREGFTIFEEYQAINGAMETDSYSAPVSTPASNYKTYNQPEIAAPKIGRNDSCFCGSGKKFKKCCMNK